MKPLSLKSTEEADPFKPRSKYLPGVGTQVHVEDLLVDRPEIDRVLQVAVLVEPPEVWGLSVDPTIDGVADQDQVGLALGSAIAAAHGGSLELVEREGPGATFRLKLPGVVATR